jgi:hypothetical protein
MYQSLEDEAFRSEVASSGGHDIKRAGQVGHPGSIRLYQRIKDVQDPNVQQRKRTCQNL